ncbi:MAG: polyphenol oxidase family protein [Patescibacteria group bacterium]|nr:polyphenol oxidase family protein [Bacteroidota bacterium]
MPEFSILKPFSGEVNHGLVLDSSEIPDAIMADQIHGDTILEVNQRPETLPQCDAFITNLKGLPLMVRVADCQGVLIYDPITRSAASVHSGWRGSALNIIGKTIEKMTEVYGSSPADLLVAISPSLGPCCAKFSEPKNELPEFCHPFIRPNNHVDFWALSTKQCLDAGIPENQLELAAECSKCRPGYPSHRNGDSKRMGVFVTLL